jgi:cytochrome c peroxidase
MWDGKVQSLVAQALLPIENPLEMGLSKAEAVKRVDSKYAKLFQAAFDGPITPERLGQALAAFQSQLKSPSNTWDSGLLTEEQLQGKGLFFGEARCASCHQGSNFTDHRLHNLGFFTSDDVGHQAISRRPSDRGKFKTPNLRGVSQTAPYFHDGRFQSLDEVLEFYNKGGDTAEGRAIEVQPLGLSGAELKSLKSFLEAL